MNDEERKRNIIKRAERIWHIAMDMTQGAHWQVQSAIEEIRLHYDGYAEPGYDDNIGIVATGNWNEVTSYDYQTQTTTILSDLPKRISEMYEKMGIECEWSDEWSNCSQCGKLIRTQADSYSWTRSYHFSEHSCEITCIDCLEEDPESYLSELEDNPDVANTMKSIDPSEYGYVCLNDESYQSGWYPGQHDDPHKIAKELSDKGVTRYLFNIDSTGQFDTHWSVYVHKDEVDLLNSEDDEYFAPDCCDSCNDTNCHSCANGPNNGKVVSVAEVIKLPVAEVIKKEIPCKFCKTSLWEDETPCWKCGTDNPTR